MATQVASGLAASWLNAWLAAVGITVLLPDARLRWTDGAQPLAEFDLPRDASLVSLIATVLPDLETVDELLIVKRHGDAAEKFGRQVSLDSFRSRAELARRRHRDFSLSISVTDLEAALDPSKLPHSDFDPPAPKGETLHDRLRRCVAYVVETDESEARIAATLQGRGRRIKANGLGFDYRRLVSGSHAGTDTYVDPVVEILAFFGLALFPVRGDGTRARTLGWSKPFSQRHAFCWPIWHPFLDRWAIDALLDRCRQHDNAGVRRLGAHGAFGTVAYKTCGQKDVTRAYASERLW